MPKFQVERKHSNVGLFIVVMLAYIALLGLFGWQTWEFVNFLFPDDQLLMKVLTLFCFDIMALIWGSLHLFYRFAHPHAKTAVGWGWAITNLLSLVATVLYMVIQSMFRFHLEVNQNTVNFGYGVTIIALVFNIAMIAIFLYNEILTRFPNEDEFELVETPKKKSTQQSASLAQQASTPVQSAEQDLHDWLYTYLGSNDAGRTPFLTWLEEHNRGIPINPATMALARRMYPLPLDIQQNGHKADETAFPSNQQK